MIKTQSDMHGDMHEIMTHAREAGVQAERARILGELKLMELASKVPDSCDRWIERKDVIDEIKRRIHNDKNSGIA